VVHLSVGIGGLVAAKVLGRRHGYGTENLSPFDLLLAVVGTELLWVADSAWGGLERSIRRKPSVVPLRVSREHGLEGLDISQHGEALQQNRLISLPWYLLSARRVGTNMSAACHA
jgi:ammonia channel protein AmtB